MALVLVTYHPASLLPGRAGRGGRGPSRAALWAAFRADLQRARAITTPASNPNPAGREWPPSRAIALDTEFDPEGHLLTYALYHPSRGALVWDTGDPPDGPRPTLSDLLRGHSPPAAGPRPAPDSLCTGRKGPEDRIRRGGQGGDSDPPFPERS